MVLCTTIVGCRHCGDYGTRNTNSGYKDDRSWRSMQSCSHWTSHTWLIARLGVLFGANAKIDLDVRLKCECGSTHRKSHVFWGWTSADETVTYISCSCGNKAIIKSKEKGHWGRAAIPIIAGVAVGAATGGAGFSLGAAFFGGATAELGYLGIETLVVSDPTPLKGFAIDFSGYTDYRVDRISIYSNALSKESSDIVSFSVASMMEGSASGRGLRNEHDCVVMEVTKGDETRYACISWPNKSSKIKGTVSYSESSAQKDGYTGVVVPYIDHAVGGGQTLRCTSQGCGAHLKAVQRYVESTFAGVKYCLAPRAGQANCQVVAKSVFDRFKK